MKIYVAALGCKLNRSEAEEWARQLVSRGCEIVKEPTLADLCILNTCTVTHVAARKSRNFARRYAKANPNTQVVLTGCYAQISPEEAERLPGVRLVLGTAAKEHLVDELAERMGLPFPNPGSSAPIAPSLRTRTTVKIQDGCDNACTYCVVRIARGHQRSRPAQDVLADILAREAEGCQEIVLTGVHIGAYGHERGETLAALVRDILTQTRFPRLRLSSIEPWDFTPELLKLWENPRLCPHVHLPLQSGCDATLRRMNRRYTTAQFRAQLDAAHAAIPNLAVTTDVIVGFPGEDEAEFTASAQFVADAHLARVHVFPYSVRPDTPAATMPDQVSPSVKGERVQRMLTIGQASAQAFRRPFLGHRMDVLWEQHNGVVWSGLTDNYIHVEAIRREDICNRILPVRVVDLTDEGVRGEFEAETPCTL